MLPESDSDPATRPLGWISATNLVIASMIGAGIFSSSGYLSGWLHSGTILIWAWLVGGLLALAGALSYGELGAMMPRAGGEYVYLRRSYGPVVGFLSGFVTFVAGFAAPAAGVALVLGAHVEKLAPSLPPWTSALGVIAVLTVAHGYGLRLGARVNDVATGLKVAFMVTFIVAGFAVTPTAAPVTEVPASPGLASTSFARALVLVAFAYTGWNAAAYVGGEISRPRRNLPRALICGTGLVTVIYVALNLVFLRAANPEEMAGLADVGAFAALRLFGDDVGALFTAGIILVLLSAISAFIMAGPRVALAMAREREVPRLFARVNDRGSPTPAVILLGAVAALMVLVVDDPEGILVFVGLLLTLSTGLAVFAVIVLRRRAPAEARPFRVPGYPLVPLLFVLLSAWIVAYGLVQPEGWRPAVASLATIALGLILRPLVRQRGREGLMP